MPNAPKFEKPLRASQHCRHYSYNMAPCCAKGLPLIEPGAANVCMPRPLHPTHPTSEKKVCAQREKYTAVERDKWEKWKTASMGRMIQILAAIPGSADRKDRLRYWGKTGTLKCPACGGTVRWTRAPNNGHLWASCSTPNCFQVMQ